MELDDDELKATKEKTADEMFEKLGYEKHFEHHDDWNTTIYNDDSTSIEFTSDKEILLTRRIDYKTVILGMQELKAINKKCKELGWIE